ncbi:hypothetical protein N7495_007680 [Penicillium taxi]|uniref:uncharacterized protein n=1 Tax=Penicillium taxi TaxID=168475 RepID=UPI002544F899|nr:uncharacterized protein N7495_007680 [Penicillium taxi]KAJ5887639.1 hypothetical protein N7495_007680 [Penicillium taxi]
MFNLPKLAVRDNDSNDSGLSGPIVDLLISLLVLVLFALVLLGSLLLIRRKRQSRQDSLLPVHNGQRNTRRLTISAGGKTNSIMVWDEKHNLIENSHSPPTSPVPAIHITFPEEEDEAGKRKSGRVVVVRISETGGVGLEPYHEDDLPPYQTSDSDRFQSLDIERMGGLKEKGELNNYH